LTKTIFEFSKTSFAVFGTSLLHEQENDASCAKMSSRLNPIGKTVFVILVAKRVASKGTTNDEGNLIVDISTIIICLLFRLNIEHMNMLTIF
jgi:hypothetical protein